MSTQGGREPLRAYRRRRNLDLNVPASEICSQDEPSVQCGTQGGQANQQGQRVQPVLLSYQGQNIPPATIDVEALDDDVIESSPRAFAEAKRKRNRRRGDVVVVEEDETSRTAPNYCNRRRMIPQKPVVIINLETNSNAANAVKQPPPPPPPPPPPQDITFNCPICIAPLVEEMSTKCGHIFCKACIKAAIAAKAKCPTCRKRVTVRELIRVFLPAASSL